MNHQLEPIPPRVRHLTTEQSDRIDQVFPRVNKRFACPTCFDTKQFRFYAEDGETNRDPSNVVTYDCSCADQFKLHRRFMHAGILEAYQRLGIDDFVYAPDAVAEALEDYIENASGYITNGIGMLFWGERGNGKTLAFALLAKMLVAEGHDVFMMKFSDMLNAFAAGWKDQADRRWYNERVRNAALLGIDDIGREHNRGSGTLGQNHLEEVLRHRVNRNLPTFITSNLSPEEMREGYGGHTASLMVEKTIHVRLVGQDRRPDIHQRNLSEVRAGITRPVMVS